MPKTFEPVLLFVAVMLATSGAQGPSQVAPVSTVKRFVNTGWSHDEAVLAKAISMRAEKVQARTGFRFDKDWKPKVSLEWGLSQGAASFDGLYEAETQTIYFPIHLMYELNARHQLTAEALDADTAAHDKELAELLDHELGHELMDQVSRRNGLGPWFTEERFNSASREEKLGLDILSEGTARYFQRMTFPRDDSRLSEESFPVTREEQRSYTYDMIAYDGGYWLVRDALNKFGERGLVWLMRHPFVASDDMRAAAVDYRRRALEELSHDSIKTSPAVRN